MSKTMISQSNYIPWKGFFDAINFVDYYIIYDEVQYTRRDWRNRNRIKTPQGPMWLSIPVEVKGKYTQKISETKVSDSKWPQQHWAAISHNYKRAPFYKEIAPYLETLYKEAAKLEYLSQVNLLFLESISKILNIKTKFIDSAEFALTPGRSERIIGICSDLQSNSYYSGPSAKTYIDEKLFNAEGIEVHYFDFANYQEYPQLYPPFEHAVSIIDLLLMAGPDAANYTFKISKQQQTDLVL